MFPRQSIASHDPLWYLLGLCRLWSDNLICEAVLHGPSSFLQADACHDARGFKGVPRPPSAWRPWMVGLVWWGLGFCLVHGFCFCVCSGICFLVCLVGWLVCLILCSLMFAWIVCFTIWLFGRPLYWRSLHYLHNPFFSNDHYFYAPDGKTD